ncbi:MAG TPA: asparagine synthase (glutamine-hydrolyzing) [Sphingomicrobium sp.]|nr:asparagine synthase (glutamine-hydrolyzing) [Sphingomicrobium sp.]
MMCGIAGIFSADRVDPALLRRMASSIAHRGPDDQGIWSDREAGIGFAHRRLSIVDLSPQGHQPMDSASGRFTICFNGEIYNFTEIRDELERAGQGPEGGWRSHSDTEVLLDAFETWGLRATLDRAVGMFALALWDAKERQLHLVRDRFGEKPLYYGLIGRDLVFGSELKALRCHPQFDTQIDRGALKAFAARTYVPAPWSIYRGIFKLQPGCILTFDRVGLLESLRRPPTEGEGGPVRMTRYWSYRDVVEQGLADPITDEAETLDQLEAVLATAIKGQSFADVPVGAFLSGGIDSSTVVAIYQKYASRPVRTYSIGFEDSGFDEAEHAKAVAQHLGTIHHEHYVTVGEARDVIPQLPAMYDEPFADSSQIPTHLVSRFARRDVTVSLTGDGGDELFAGYNRHFLAPRLWRHIDRLPKPVRVLAAALLGRISPGIWSRAASLIDRNNGPFVGNRIQKALRVARSASSFDEVYLSFLDEWSLEENPVLAPERDCPFDLGIGGASDTVRMMYCDAVSYLPDDILAKVDRASMAVGLETRVPFLDHRVAALAARIPVEMKIRGMHGKHILRQMLYRELPPALFERPKAGFAVPIGKWIKGPLRDWAEALLDPARMAEEGWFDPAIVHRRWRDHLAGRRDSTPALWAVLMFQSWLREQQRPMALAA